MADDLTQLVLEREDGGGPEYEEGNDDLEGPGRRGEEEQAAGRRAGDRGRDEREEAAGAGEVGAAADDAGDVPGGDGDTVGHVGRHRTEAGCQQSGKRDERPTTGDRVDRAGREPGRDEEGGVGEIHGGATCTMCSDGRVDWAAASAIFAAEERPGSTGQGGC